jgi:arylsulfatase A
MSRYVQIFMMFMVSLWAHSFCAERAPNFIVIFIDDMGYADIEPFGSTLSDTPQLNRMAAEGMKLTDFYVASPVCTPSRASLMTGCYPQRVGLHTGSKRIVLFPGDPHGLNPKEITIAEVLKEKGYATGCFGKWHLGDQKEFLPTNQGFDTYFGIPYSNDMWQGHKSYDFPKLPLMEGNEVIDTVDTMEDQGELCRLFTEKAIDFIEKNHEQPFFCYIPHAYVHWPRMARKEFVDQAQAKGMRDKYLEAQVEELDWSVGEILKKCRDLNIDENTMVIFTSDNGPAGWDAPPLRGRKGSGYEGGHRVPTLAWWPGRIPAGRVCSELASTMDLLPTFAKYAGTTAPQDRVIDGKDISALLEGRPKAMSPHEHFFYQEGSRLAGVRSGDWKYLTSKNQLYHLKEDIGETTNVAEQFPEKVKAMKRVMKDFQNSLKSTSRPVGVHENSRTILPRPGLSGDEAHWPTLDCPKKRKS